MMGLANFSRSLTHLVTYLVIPIFVFILLAYHYYIISRFMDRVSKRKSEIYNIPRTKLRYLGLVAPAPRNQKSLLDVAYRRFYNRECKRAVATSLVFWVFIYLLNRL